MQGWILYRDKITAPEISSNAIDRLMESAEANGVSLTLVRPEQIDLVVNVPPSKQIGLDGRLVPLPDFIIPRTGAATSYLALSAIRHLEHLGVYCLNSANAIAASRDKLAQMQLLAQAGLPVPRTMLAQFPVDLTVVQHSIGFPTVIKAVSGSKGSGVHLCRTPGELEDILMLLESVNKQAAVILQEFIEYSLGRDVRVLTLGNQAIAAMERRAAGSGFKANYSRGGEVLPFDITPDVAKLAVAVAGVFGLEMAGVDLLFDKAGFIICEVNSAPGFQGLEKASGTDIAKAIFDFVRHKVSEIEQ
ncbi:MAG: RimK family alpha-L-glutamate ligase [Saprospiraceae bacterium]|nr:RimK family alpha-L-glutamate ligase [Saprospiraceae bacterium]